MIGILLQGRLGNQLFQYAFAYATSKKLGVNFYLDQRIENFKVSSYFNIPSSKFSVSEQSIFTIKGYKNFFSYHLRKKWYEFLQKCYGLKTVIFNSDVDPIIELKKIKNNILYDGFFQSEVYFEMYAQEIKELFNIKPVYYDAYQQVFNKIPKNKKLIAIHIRKGDYVHLGLNLDISYYHNAIKKVEVSNPYYIFLSDEPATIENEFDYIGNKYISVNPEIIDLQFLMNADFCILSNSSFSWWGAYLNTKKAEIIAPEFWAGKNNVEFPKGIIQTNWTKQPEATPPNAKSNESNYE